MCQQLGPVELPLTSRAFTGGGQSMSSTSDNRSEVWGRPCAESSIRGDDCSVEIDGREPRSFTTRCWL